MTKRTEWCVSIDESGDFSNPADRVCVGGLLLQESNSAALQLALETQLGVIFPHLTYPPHATCYNHPSLHLVAWKRLSKDARDAVPRRVADLLDQAEQRVLAVPGTPAELSQPTSGPPPGPRQLGQHDDWLRNEAPEALDPLKEVRSFSQTKLEQLFAELARCYPGRCAVVAAAEAPAAPGTPPAPERYLRLLEVLFERLIALLRSGPPGPSLVVRVASRGVRRPTGTSTLLTEADIRAVFADALRASPPGVDIELQIRPPEEYDASVHPSLVLADYAMNRLRSLLGARTWGSLAGQVKAAFRLPAELFVPNSGRLLPTIAADGVPRQAIHAALADPTAPRPPAVELGWTMQQADRWVAALAALPREEVAQ